MAVMSKKIRVGIIGLGIMGHRMLTNMPKEQRLEVVGAWDISSSECDRAAEAFPGLKIMDNADALITAENVDLVYIGVPPQFHYSYANSCVEAGKAIFCEKPLCISVENGQNLSRLVTKNGIFNAVNLSLASASAIDILRQDMMSGAFGDVETAEIILDFSIWPRGWQQNADWLKYRADGGFTREVTTHFLYLCDSLFGPGRVLRKSIQYAEEPQLCETRLEAELQFGNTTVTLRSKVDATAEDKIAFHVYGKNKSFRLIDFYKGYLETAALEKPLFTENEDIAEEARNAQLSRLVDQYLGGDKQIPSFEDALRVQCLIEELLDN
jgi:predicted dehydrogenase